MVPFVALGLEFGFEISILEPTTAWWIEKDVNALAERNAHDVSAATIQRMLDRWESATVESILASKLL